MGHFPDWVSVKKGSVEVTYDIGYYVYDGKEPDEKQYDVRVSNGDESDEWFPTAEEAESWVVHRFG